MANTIPICTIYNIFNIKKCQTITNSLSCSNSVYNYYNKKKLLPRSTVSIKDFGIHFDNQISFNSTLFMLKINFSKYFITFFVSTVFFLIRIILNSYIICP